VQGKECVWVRARRFVISAQLLLLLPLNCCWRCRYDSNIPAISRSAAAADHKLRKQLHTQGPTSMVVQAARRSSVIS
jgi:hypothetical protein